MFDLSNIYFLCYTLSMYICVCKAITEKQLEEALLAHSNGPK